MFRLAQRKQCFAAASLISTESLRCSPNVALWQILRRVHLGNETTSSGGSRTPLLGRTRQHDTRRTIPARASWHCSARDGGVGWHRDPTPPRVVTGTSCGDLLADKFRELCFSRKRGHQCTKTWATHFDVAGTAVHGSEDELGNLHGDRGPVSVLCAFDPLSWLFRLKGLFHCGTILLLQTVVVGRELALDLGRCLSYGCHQLFLC